MADLFAIGWFCTGILVGGLIQMIWGDRVLRDLARRIKQLEQK